MMKTRLAIAALVTVELALSTSGVLAAQRTHHHHASPALLSSKGSGALAKISEIDRDLATDLFISG